MINTVILLAKRSSPFGIFFLSLLLLATSCKEGSFEKLEATPTAFGKLNQVVVVADQSAWESALGDTFRYYFSSPFLILPQPEPVFDLKHFTPAQLREDPLRRELRNYIILADLSDPESATARLVERDVSEDKLAEARDAGKIGSAVGVDKWAKGQVVIYLFGASGQQLTAQMSRIFPVVRDRIYQADAPKVVATVYQGGDNVKLMNQVRDALGIELRLPKDYFLAINKEGTLWLRKETEDLSSNILLARIPYSDKAQLTTEGLKAIRDSLGRKYISTRVPNSYMTTNDQDLPLFAKPMTINNHYGLEIHGIWEMENDYMGGAFVSYGILDQEKGEIVFADGFVFAPGKEKRDYVMFLETILRSIRF